MSALAETTRRAPAGVAELRTSFRDGKAALLERFGSARATAHAAGQLVRQLTRHVDTTLAQLWADCGLPAGAALVAVGGYGRGELFPYSDIDVLVLLPAEADESVATTVSAFVTACWDTGLEIGSSVRSVDECTAEAARDVTVQTALLEARHVCGAKRLYTQFRKAHAAALCAPRCVARRETKNF